MEQILMCNVSHPYLRRRVKAVIQIMFSIASNMSWADHILLAINVTSDGNITSSSTEHEVPVLYPIHIISRVENSTKHVPITKTDMSAKATHRYKIQNLGLYDVPINLSVSVSSYEAWIEGVSWDFIISSSQNSNVRCLELNDSSAILSERMETMRNKTWQCRMEESGEMSINISGLVKPRNAWKVHGLVTVRSEVMIRYNQLKYHSDGKYHTAQVVTQVELLVIPEHRAYIAVGTGVGVILMIVISILLYMCGFFRRYKDRMMEEAASCDPQQQTEGKDPDAAAQLMGPPETQTSKSL
ncbi:integrin alpha-L-like [Hyla sarda]|uniref:integrin alpha-L-like n=1 Tax=Hyla sarda TaxID=327740 RepID=UPI0024C2A680|nr:integrin alpha-L-like [Hyla sarda]